MGDHEQLAYEDDEKNFARLFAQFRHEQVAAEHTKEDQEREGPDCDEQVLVEQVERDFGEFGVVRLRRLAFEIVGFVV